MHLVVYDMADLSEVHRIYNLIVAVVFVAVEIFRLAPVPCFRNVRDLIVSTLGYSPRSYLPTHLSNAGRASRWASRPSPASA